MSQTAENEIASHEARLHFRDGRYEALLEVANYTNKAASTAFMGFTAEGDAVAKELRSLGAMFGRWAEEARKSRHAANELPPQDTSA